MTLIASRKGEWFLCHVAPEVFKGVNLEAPGVPAHDTHLFRLSRQGKWFANFSSPEGITFYKEAKWNGLRVALQMWDVNRQEPILRCLLSREDLPPYSNDSEYMKLIEEMRAQDWAWDYRDGGVRYIHVDELEKVPGPPPAGVF